MSELEILLPLIFMVAIFFLCMPKVPSFTNGFSIKEFVNSIWDTILLIVFFPFLILFAIIVRVMDCVAYVIDSIIYWYKWIKNTIRDNAFRKNSDYCPKCGKNANNIKIRYVMKDDYYEIKCLVCGHSVKCDYKYD